MVTPDMKGRKLLSLYKKIREWPASKIFSARRDPLVPVEKFSKDLTVFFYNGTEVPPLVTK